jgi:thiosulfate reductase / polysulfide reductase chain A
VFREAMQRVFPNGVGHASYMVYPAPTCCWSAILDADPYPIKAVISQGTNTLVALANGRRIYEAFMSDNLELHVAMDHWRTPSTELADYLLPATDGLERPNLVGMWGFGGACGAAARTVSPRYERRDDYDLWRDLGNKLGQHGDWPETLEGWFDKLLAPSKMSFAELTQRDLAWVFTERQYKRHEERGFATSSGKVELVSGVLEKLGYDAMP